MKFSVDTNEINNALSIVSHALSARTTLPIQEGMRNTEEYKNVVMTSVNEMLSIKVDGIIYIAAHAHDVEYFPPDLPVPIVISYAYQSNNKIPALRIDDETAGYDMTKYLISKGHKKIAIIAGEEQDLHGHDRLVGFERAMKEAGLSVDKNLLVAGRWSRGNGYLACKELFEKCRISLNAGGEDSSQWDMYLGKFNVIRLRIFLIFLRTLLINQHHLFCINFLMLLLNLVHHLN